MSLSLTSAVKDKVAYRLYSKAYASCATHEQGLIDGEGAEALITLQQYAQYFEMVSGSQAPDQWSPWFVHEIVYRIADNAHPDRDGNNVYRKKRLEAMREAMETYSKAAITADPTTSEAFVYTTQNVRYYALAACGKRGFFPPVHQIDAAFDECYKFLWNKAKWPYRRRPVRMTVTRSAFTGGTYTHATKTISGLTSVSTSLPAGTRFYVTSGTSATTGEYVIASTTSTTIVLATTIGSAANGSTDIAGFYFVITFDGMETNETFDSISSCRWYCETSGNEGSILKFVTADVMSRLRQQDGVDTGVPGWFRVFDVGSAHTFEFSPIPDGNYTYRGEILTTTGPAPTSAADTVPFGKMIPEMLPTLRRMVLARLLTNCGKHDENLSREVSDEIEALFPVYAGAGDPERIVETPDFYGDHYMQGGSWSCGGGT